MGTWAIIGRAEQRDGDDLDGSSRDGIIIAPALGVLQSGAPLVLATLPVVDWNSELVKALTELKRPVGPNCFAAVMMIDPFTLWEDLGDLLAERGFAGVVNFPPASLLEVKQVQTSTDEGNMIEIDRMKWFHDVGFGLVYTASRVEEIRNVEQRLSGLLEAIVNVPVTSLGRPLSDTLELELDPTLNVERQGLPPVLSFTSAAGATPESVAS
ncbi:hypothetical protein [Rhizobium tubonense]|uniref:TIM-barrel domain-containing protein n=1 Tax=Rhizobium tubonense TaxID=484088 RepID=A0A2W4CIZ7_9HYPH|nr:hypothetical protein [Rhizobium tubonense]PZM12919.1 hypothetical protein CPY51_15375 [Rhizobium tubonense]